MASKTFIWCRSVYVVVARNLWSWFLGGLGLSYSGIIQPRGTGFYCDDRTIRHRYQGDTVSVYQLLISTLIGPIFFIIPTEGIKKWKKEKGQEIRTRLLNIWKSSWKAWRADLLGVLVALVLTEFAKSVVSEARPHFWDTCKPNITEEPCHQLYITEYECTSGNSRSLILDAQKSFPSGHTSVSVFSAVYMMWYLNRADPWQKSSLLTPCLQLLWACFALYCSLTRITDHRHHWWDVLAGAVLGLAVAFVVTRAMEQTVRVYEVPLTMEEVNPVTVQDGIELNSTKQNHSKRLSVRRLLSTTSVSTAITEDRELDDFIGTS